MYKINILNSMGINLKNFLSSKSKNTKMIDFQDLDHLDGLSISTVSASLYKDIRDDLTMFYFREGETDATRPGAKGHAE